MNSSHQTRSSCLALLAASAMLLAPVPALAGAPADPDAISEAPNEGTPEEEMQDSRTRAIEAYRKGTELYNDAQFSEALVSFEEAATLYASPDFQFNIGKCYERLGDYEQAIRHYETYLRTAGDTPDRPVIETTIEDLEKKIAEQEAQAEADANAAADANRANPADDMPSGRPLVITGGALLGVGVVLGLGGGLGFGIPVSRDNASLGDVLGGNPDELTFAEADELASRARTNQTLELVMIGVGGAIAITGAVLLVIGVKRNKAKTDADLRFAPTWSREGGGLTLQGNF